MHWLDINTLCCTVLGYPMSYVELIGAVTGLASVWLAPRTRRRGRDRGKNGLIQAVFNPFDRSRRGSRRQGGLFQRAAMSRTAPDSTPRRESACTKAISKRIRARGFR